MDSPFPAENASHRSKESEWRMRFINFQRGPSECEGRAPKARSRSLFDFFGASILGHCRSESDINCSVNERNMPDRNIPHFNWRAIISRRLWPRRNSAPKSGALDKRMTRAKGSSEKIEKRRWKMRERRGGTAARTGRAKERGEGWNGRKGRKKCRPRRSRAKARIGRVVISRKMSSESSCARVLFVYLSSSFFYMLSIHFNYSLSERLSELSLPELEIENSEVFLQTQLFAKIRRLRLEKLFCKKTLCWS